MAGLKAMGWTEAGIKQFLGKPDKLVTNLHYASGPKVRLYAIERVHAVMATAAWQAWQQSSERRSARGKQMANCKRMELLETIKRLTIIVPVMPKGTLVKWACASYNERLRWREAFDLEQATPNSEAGFLRRICVNYLRHEYTHYEDELERIYGKVGVGEAYLALFRRVGEAIAAAYPHLAEECQAQFVKRSAG